MTNSQILEQKSAPNSFIIPEKQVVLNSVSLTQKETETSEAVKNTLVSKGHRLYIEDFDNLKRVETVNLKFLKLLNYNPTDTIFARVIAKLTDEEKEQGKKAHPPEKRSGIFSSLIKDLKDCNENKNQNVYFVVNGGGHKAEDVKVGRALMLEIDKDEQGNLIPIDDQYQIMVDKFGIPTVAVFTGNKSLHCYYVYEEPIDTELWQQMQLDALAYCSIADQSIKDLSRVLRLVGFKHSETGDYSEVYAESGKKYSYDELRSRIPERPVETKKQTPIAKNKQARKTTKVAAPNTAPEKPYPPLDEDVNSIAVPNSFKDAHRFIEAGTDKNGLLITNNINNHSFIEFDTDDYVDILPLEFLVRLLEIKTALEVVDPEICEDYDTWLKIGMALHHEGSTNGNPDFSDGMRELFHAWSRSSDKYEEEVTENKWASFGDRDNNITINTLFHYAQEQKKNVNKLMREIYPLVDAYCPKRELDAQKQKLTAALKAGDSIEYMDKMPMRKRVSHYIENYMSKDLRYNLHSREFEYKGEILDIHDFHLHLVVAFNKEVSEAIFRKAYEKYANEYAYHPFQEYIEGLLDKNYKPSEEDYQNAVNYLNKVAKEYLRAQNEFEHLLFRKWILGVVCRVLSPGYKFDGVLMLKGAQGLGKTTFFESIAGLEYYRSHLGSIDRDSLAKMHRAIIIELAEIAATFGKVKNEALKNFITERVDTFRRPYGYSDLDHPRRFVFGGSTNDDEFLTDPTGSRRYWVIEINEMIDTAAIQENRDEIFRAAYIMKLHGDEPYLKPEESVTNEERNSTHKKVTLLEEAIAEIVHERMKQQEKVKNTTGNKNMFRIPFLSNDIVKDLKDTHPSLKPTNHGINAALKALGFKQEHKRVNGKSGRWWEPTPKYYEQNYEAGAS